MSIPAHLFRRNGIFYFRWAFPARVRRLIRPESHNEIRLSLRCHERRAAILAAFQLWQRALSIADNMVAAGMPVGYTEFMAQLSPEQEENSIQAVTIATAPVSVAEPQPIADVLGTYDVPTLQRAIAALHNRNMPVFVSVSGCAVTLYNRIEVGMNEFEEEIADTDENYGPGNVRLLPETVTNIVGASGNLFTFERFLAPRISLSRDTDDHYQFAEATQPIQKNITQVRAATKDIQAIKGLIATSTIAPSHPSKILVSTISLQDAKAKWVTAHTALGKDSSWNANTAKEHPAFVALFIDIIGDKLVADVTPQDAQEFRDVIRFLPPHFRKRPQYASLSPKEAATLNELQNGQQASATTINKKIQAVTSFFLFCVRERYVAASPFANLDNPYAKAAKKKQKREKSREPFTDEDLKLLFESDVAIKLFEKQKPASRLWAPVLSLYTGARMAELCEMRADQVRVKDGVHYIELIEWDENAHRLKNESATRQIPLHSILIDLGFVAYAKSRKNPSNPLIALFPEQEGLEHKQGNKIVSKFFNEKLLTIIGIKTAKKVFHSFRHTVIDILKRTAEQDRFISSFIGHEDEQVQTWKDKYGTPLGATETAHLLKYLNYPIDWTAFKALLKRKGLAG